MQGKKVVQRGFCDTHMQEPFLREAFRPIYQSRKPPILETSISVNPVYNYHSRNHLYGQSQILVSKTTSHFFQA